MTLSEAIEALGKTPSEVTAKLREKGIKGYRMVASSCPIAKYLNGCGFQYVTVSTFVNIYSKLDSVDVAEESCCLPKGVREWITDFDQGIYPEFYIDPFMQCI